MESRLLILFLKRTLSLLNRNPYLKTYGCFDRDFWHYKTLRDFPSAPYQNGVLSLALAYKNDFDGNEFYKNEKILELIKAGIDYWSSIQNNDGSFNEWFSNEHSQVATAFTLAAITETILILKDEIKFSNNVFAAMKKAGDWLAKNPDYLVTNHSAGALLALYNLYLLSEDNKYMEAVQNHLSIILKNQNDEGWFLEYDGCDLGYLSLTVSFLAKYYKKSGDQKLLAPLEKALNFMGYFVHPDGTFGGEYGSRNTKYIFFSGLVFLSDIFPKAKSLFAKCWKSAGDSANLVSDDRYFNFFFLNDYLESFLSIKRDLSLSKEEVVAEEEFEIDFYNAGIFAKRNAKYYLIVNYKKGGVIKLFSIRDKKIVYGDTGYVIKTDKGIFYSQNIGGNQSFKIEKRADKTMIFLEQKFSFYKDLYPLEKFMIPFKIFNCAFGRSEAIMRFFNRILKDRMILKSRQADIILKRNMEIAEDCVKISDEIINNSGMKILSREKINDVSFRHVPSSRFFRANDFFYQPRNSDIEEIKF